jgi:hypothetical protein
MKKIQVDTSLTILKKHSYFKLIFSFLHNFFDFLKSLFENFFISQEKFVLLDCFTKTFEKFIK